jgi:hypothetical protein
VTIEGKERRAGRGCTLRRDEKSAEVIDKQRVVMRPLCRYGCKLLKRKGLKAGRAGEESADCLKVGVCEWHFEAQREQTSDSVA